MDAEDIIKIMDWVIGREARARQYIENVDAAARRAAERGDTLVAENEQLKAKLEEREAVVASLRAMVDGANGGTGVG